MAIAGRPMGQGGSPGRAAPSWVPHAAAAVVLVVGLGITITLSVVTASGHQRTNAKLLALQTRLISDEIARPTRSTSRTTWAAPPAWRRRRMAARPLFSAR